MEVCSLLLVLLVLLVSQSILPSLALVMNATATTPSKPALIVFGDSIVDPGNNNLLSTIAKCNFPPYGMDFESWRPTGRFSNGKIPTDFLASRMGIKEYLPAYLDPQLEPKELLTGVSFGSGGTGYDPLTSGLVSVLSMQYQLELFKEYKEKLKKIAGEERAAAIISGSVYLVCSGTNDIANTYYTTLLRRSDYDLVSYVDLMVNSATAFVQDLASLGARVIGFVGLPPIGCLPSQRTSGGGITRECEPSRNQAALLFNSKMVEVLQDIQNKAQGTTIVFIDIYSILINIIQRPLDYGFVEVSRGCCGTGEVESAYLCNRLTPVTCPDDTTYLFWDSFHPTERAYQIVADYIMQKYRRYLK